MLISTVNWTNKENYYLIVVLCRLFRVRQISYSIVMLPANGAALNCCQVMTLGRERTLLTIVRPVSRLPLPIDGVTGVRTGERASRPESIVPELKDCFRRAFSLDQC